ncbi:MAG TPA: S8 family serine peptidase [Acidimicrobiales bacterium]|nr:S8 family serine peptidase [Acidimicrobiales bacterium]
MVRRFVKRTLASVLAAATFIGAGSIEQAHSRAWADTQAEVIVTSTGVTSPVSAVLQYGGTVLTQYTIINGVDAMVPVSSEPLLAALPGIVVTPDVSVSVQSTPESTGPHTPSDAFLGQTGAQQLAAAGDTGQGATVAVLDTGIDNLPDFSGRLVGGVDLSGEGNAFQDSYGHGTFVAGLIAGNGASSNGQYSGEAPAANLVSVKVAGASGSTKLGTLISGLQWVQRNQSAFNIRVLNISLGYQPSQSSLTDPLDNAVERVWSSGVAVIVSAGNAGPFNGTILSPGDDPMVVTVGSLDDMAQGNVANDEMTNFSSVGPTSPDGWMKPDLVTSGRSLVSLAAPGSTVYQSNPSAVVGTGNFVGTGTSFSSAITSGAAALVITRHPTYTANQVKAALLGTTNPGPTGNPFVDGHGALNAYGAATTTGLEPASNGQTVSLNPTGNPVDTWNQALWTGQPWTSTAWNSTAWNSTGWNSTAWNSTAWNGYAWDSTAWNGFECNSTAWNSTAWNGAAWNSTAWNGSAWDSTAWNSTAWNSTAWNSTAWNSTAWNGSAWN